MQIFWISIGGIKNVNTKSNDIKNIFIRNTCFKIEATSIKSTSDNYIGDIGIIVFYLQDSYNKVFHIINTCINNVFAENTSLIK